MAFILLYITIIKTVNLNANFVCNYKHMLNQVRSGRQSSRRQHIQFVLLETPYHPHNFLYQRWWNSCHTLLHALPIIIPHDDVIKWELFSYYWPIVMGIHRWPVNSHHKGQWRGVSCFLSSAPEKIVEQTIEAPVIWDTIALIRTSR